jgi:hypothetical protein
LINETKSEFPKVLQYLLFIGNQAFQQGPMEGCNFRPVIQKGNEGSLPERVIGKRRHSRRNRGPNKYLKKHFVFFAGWWSHLDFNVHEGRQALSQLKLKGPSTTYLSSTPPRSLVIVTFLI